ncbi:MAG: MBL fold metallo-hydrolase [Caldilineaceae bacterium]|nr:MBL fold metallo-hydrolase [Caldilineaceae bacterium]
MIQPIRLPIANAYLVQGTRPILVDTGAPGDTARIVRALQQNGVALTDLALILLTHGHGDHAGSAAALRQQSGAPVMIHRADLDMIQAGRNRPFHTTSLEAKLIKPFVNRPFPPVDADIVVDGATELAAFGIAGQLLSIPGHTHGSVALLLQEPDRKQPAAIVGDLLMGGRFGGALWPTWPQQHYFAEAPGLLPKSLERLLAQQPHRFYVGHGGPLDGQRVQQVATRLYKS